MSNLSDRELNNALEGIVYGTLHAYLKPLTDKHLPRKEVISEAKKDIQKVLEKVDSDGCTVSIRRLKVYKSILDILEKLPSEDLARETNFTGAVGDFIEKFYLNTGSLERNELPSNLIRAKYVLIAEKANLEDVIRYGNSVKSDPVMVELGDKLLELLNP